MCWREYVQGDACSDELQAQGNATSLEGEGGGRVERWRRTLRLSARSPGRDLSYVFIIHLRCCPTTDAVNLARMDMIASIPRSNDTRGEVMSVHINSSNVP